ncbi:hypothetical protein FRB94_009949 [Tulasnella sp. JGI-2019a]|nr:hypothetical protein FRB94_009949 [Tulasnella sp. JGI-2019a]
MIEGQMSTTPASAGKRGAGMVNRWKKGGPLERELRAGFSVSVSASVSSRYWPKVTRAYACG